MKEQEQKTLFFYSGRYANNHKGPCFNCGNFGHCKLWSHAERNCTGYACPLTYKVVAAALGIGIAAVQYRVTEYGKAGARSLVEEVRGKYEVFQQGGVYFIKGFATSPKDAKKKTKGVKLNGKINRAAKKRAPKKSRNHEKSGLNNNRTV